MLITAGCANSAPIRGARNNGRCAKIKYVTIKHMCDLDFKTIGEYFGDKKEHQYFRCVTRDSENERNGVYFIVGFDRPISGLPRTITAKISVVTSLKNGIATFECKIPEHGRPALTSEIYCGIVSEKIDIGKIIAWNIEFVGESGNVMFSEHSYMWTL
jgi:hypothetical protein